MYLAHLFTTSSDFELIMRKLTKQLIVALSTFVLGLSISYLVQLRRDSAIYRAVEIPEFCEVHGERLSTVKLEFVCGEFRNNRGDYLKHLVLVIRIRNFLRKMHCSFFI